MVPDCGAAEERRRLLGWGGGRMEASLPGFHVEEIHLLELIKI